MVTCYIGLGSNLEQPGQQIIRAVAELSSLRSSSLERMSSYYKSKALGPPNQPDYLNAVAQLQTSLSAADLLAELQAIESAHGRIRKEHWGPRTLDLDILLFGQQVIESPELKVPHPEIKNRNFVLIPLYEIAAELTIPAMGNVADLVAQIDRSGLVLIDVDESWHE